jgi:hypothetical protein
MRLAGRRAFRNQFTMGRQPLRKGRGLANGPQFVVIEARQPGEAKFSGTRGLG